MSATTGDRAASLFFDAALFADFLHAASDPETVGAMNSDLEIEMGRLANRIASKLIDLDQDRTSLPIHTQVGITSLRRLFLDLIRQWRWKNVIGPNGEQFLKERQKSLTKRKREYLSVVIAYVNRCIDEDRVELLTPEDIRFAELARREGVRESAMSLEKAKTQLEPLLRQWKRTPCLARAFPSCTPDQFREFEQIIVEDEARVGERQ
jgi:hypothetical protein